MKKYVIAAAAAILAACLLLACASDRTGGGKTAEDGISVPERAEHDGNNQNDQNHEKDQNNEKDQSNETNQKNKNDQSNEKDENEERKLRIVTTIFPEYDWVRNILGDSAEHTELTMLLDTGVDLHSYQPTAEDIRKISDGDLFIYVGGESDEWVEDVLRTADNRKLKTISLLEVLGDRVRPEEQKEGMMKEEDGKEADSPEEDGEEMDEHVWLSLRNAGILCGAIAETLEETDPANAERYRINAEEYGKKLSALDESYSKAVEAAKKKTVVFGDRFPFRYLTDDYGLDYYAAFSGCSAESEASFETVLFLARKVEEAGLSAILTIEGKQHPIAETVRRNTVSGKQQILTMNSMQSVTAKDVRDGADYLSIMTENLAVLKEALR
ncbi:MAG: zinc ABC transporter substrate-binding protein [Bacillota bacterium]|nr:zinc ABC transporter substrate-binding protein [Bacillota bacterium]